MDTPEQPKGRPKIPERDDSDSDDVELDEEEDEWETKAIKKNSANIDKEINRLPIKTAEGQLVKPKEALEVVELDEEELKDNPLLTEKQKKKLEKKNQLKEERKKAKQAAKAAKEEVTFDDDEDEKYIQEHNQSVASKKSKIEEEEEEEEDPKIANKKKLINLKEELGLIASSIIEDPDNNIGKLKRLREISQDENIPIKKLSFLTQLAVYKDIIPGYRIRQLSESEKNAKVSKEVKKLRQYESTLLINYQQYLQSLDNVIEGYFKYKKLNINESEKKQNESKSLLLIAIQCLTDLLTSVPHFNFRINILTAVVARMNIKNPVEISNKCCKSIAVLFTKDETGEYSLEAMKLISRLIKNKNYNVREQVLQTFLYLRLKDELKLPDKEEENKNKNNKRKKKQQPFLTRKARKVLKENKEVEKEMKEYEATIDLEKRQKMQTETLNILFALYFRMLKNNNNNRLLPTVLEGLGRFAHLINIDFFDDLISVLKNIMMEQYKNYMDNKGHITSACTAFHCIIAAFQLLFKQGDIINIDLNDFNRSMYAQMIRLSLNPNVGKVSNSLLKTDSVYRSKSEIELVLIGFEFLFIKKKQLSFERIAAFIKRLAIITINMPVNSVLASLYMIKSLFIKYSRLNQLMDSEGRVGTGVYMGLLDDPDLCNPFATSLWEFGLLKSHFHPTVREYADYVGAIGRNGSSNVTAGPHAAKYLDYKIDHNYFLEHFGVHKFNPQEEFLRPIKSIPKRKRHQGTMYGFNGGESQFLKNLQKKVNMPVV